MTCAFAVRGAIKKFGAVESVEVGLKRGFATVKLKPGNTLKPEDLWNAVRKAGYTPKQTMVRVRGEVQAGQFKVSGTDQVFPLEADPKNPKALAEIETQASKTLTIQGSLTPEKDTKTNGAIRVMELVL